ncbi:MAG: hypothetical protein JOZ15_11830, partial [Acidobacteria bacterium]|nr:hypothetical protein [Acidobacteriota bacterium]
MRQAAHLVPQAERLLRRIEGLDLPLIELWGWPGGGSSAVLQVLLGRPEVAGLALADLAKEETARGVMAASAARWLVVAGDPAERLDDLASWLLPGQQLVFASRRRRSGGRLAVALVPPQELLLTVPEVARLWHLICGKPPGASTAQALWRASDGWFRPLRMALEATGGAGLESATAEQLLEIPPVRLFLRHEVLDSLPAHEREQLLAAARDRPGAAPDGGGGAAEAAGRGGEARLDGWQVVEDLGLWVEGGDRDRLPALLAACLERERRRRPRPQAAAGGGALPAAVGSGAASDGDVGGEIGDRRNIADGRDVAIRQDGSARRRDGLAQQDGWAGQGGSVGQDGSARQDGPAGQGGPAGHDGPAGRDGPARSTGGTAWPGNGQVRRAAGMGEGAPAVRLSYQVRLFGGPAVRQLTADGEREVGWKLRRSFQVLAFLASSPDLQAGR